jgi:hypothetical protein
MIYNTLHEVINVIELDMKSRKITYNLADKPEWMFKTLNYGETERTSFPIKKNGKNIKAYYHAVIQRLNNGYYELVNYVY